MKVPLSVMSGKSPMKMSCSLISPAFSPDLILSRMRTLSGAANVVSCSRHSSSLILGAPNEYPGSSSGPGTASSRSMLRLVKSWIGEISANSSLSPSRRNHSNESRWTLIRLGMGATSLIRANECRAAPSARARETGLASASAMGLLTPPLCAGTTGQRNDDDERDDQDESAARVCDGANGCIRRRVTGGRCCLLKRELQV